MQNIINFLKGKKTIIVGICAIIYGFYIKDTNTIILGSGLIGIRSGVLNVEQAIVPIVLAQSTASTSIIASGTIAAEVAPLATGRTDLAQAPSTQV